MLRKMLLEMLLKKAPFLSLPFILEIIPPFERENLKPVPLLLGDFDDVRLHDDLVRLGLVPNP